MSGKLRYKSSVLSSNRLESYKQCAAWVLLCRSNPSSKNHCADDVVPIVGKTSLGTSADSEVEAPIIRDYTQSRSTKFHHCT